MCVRACFCMGMATSSAGGRAIAGVGLLRDSIDAWLGGYAVKDGEGSVLLVELNGVHHGLGMA